VNVESIGTVLGKPRNCYVPVFRLQMDVWAFSQRHGEGGVSDVKHTAPLGVIQVLAATNPVARL